MKSGKRQPLPPVTAVGGKGRHLYWLATHGFPVPPTWVFSTDTFNLAAEQTGQTETIAQLSQVIDSLADDWTAVQHTLETLEPQRLAVTEALRQVPLFDQVSEALEDLPSEPSQWAIRSSATVEDTRRYSFAGQFLSLLSVPRGGEQWDAIRQVWASTFRQEVLSYCAQHNVTLPQMAVILQPMTPITAQDRSGVAFSHSPIPTLPGVLIQAAHGTGQVVVRGYGGDLYSVRGTNVLTRPISPPNIQVTGPQGNIVSETTPPGLALTEEEARELADLVLAVARSWRAPVNVEFVWRADKEPVLVQVRSITYLPVP